MTIGVKGTGARYGFGYTDNRRAENGLFIRVSYIVSIVKKVQRLKEAESS
jgi:hypothetical protein